MSEALIGPIIGLIAAIVGALGAITAALLRGNFWLKRIRTEQVSATAAADDQAKVTGDVLATVNGLRDMQSTTWGQQLETSGQLRAFISELGRLNRARQSDHDRLVRIETALDLGLLPDPTRRNHDRHDRDD